MTRSVSHGILFQQCNISDRRKERKATMKAGRRGKSDSDMHAMTMVKMKEENKRQDVQHSARTEKRTYTSPGEKYPTRRLGDGELVAAFVEAENKKRSRNKNKGKKTKYMTSNTQTLLTPPSQRNHMLSSVSAPSSQVEGNTGCESARPAFRRKPAMVWRLIRPPCDDEVA
jgi:hypothetical protein